MTASPHDRTGDAPWWASGADDLDDADPLEAHQTARSEAAREKPAHGDAPDPDQPRAWEVPWEDWDHRDAPPPQGSQRSAWDDAVEGFQTIAKLAASRRGDGGGRSRPHDETCRACPWCMALRTLGDSRPEVVAHLEEAMRHMVSAARAVVDAAEQRSGGYESIPLDEDPSDPPRDTPRDDGTAA